MRAELRSLVGICVALALLGCSSPPPRRPLGQWETEAKPRAALPPVEGPTAPPRPQARWLLAEELPKLKAVEKRSRSEHMTGDGEGELLASPSATPYPAIGPATVLAPGATLVERYFEHGAATPTVYFVMVKRDPGYDAAGGNWEYLAVSPDGRIEDRGVMPLCARCHADAPHDHLFGGR